MIKNAIIFAAGKGSRLTTYTKHVPKPLIKILNKETNQDEALIERNIKFLHQSGIKEIYVVVGYLKKQFNYLVKKYGVTLIENDKFEYENNISSLAVSIEHWGDTLYIEGDIYLTKNIIPDLIKEIEESNYKSIYWGAEDERINETCFILRNNLIVGQYAKNMIKGDLKWTGLGYVNKDFGDYMRSHFNDYYSIPENKQNYYEQFLWSLNQPVECHITSKNNFYEIDNFYDLISVDERYRTHDVVKLWTPGPTNIDQEISDLILKGIVHHRSNLAEFYITKLHDNLKQVFNTTKATPIIITASGTGVMESAVVNLINSKDKVILISVGDFGDRFYEILKLYLEDEKNILFFRYPDYSTYNIDDFKHLIPEVKAVFVTHHETSTGVLNNISELGKLTKDTDTLLICDSVSSVLNEEFNFDEWGVDIAFASSAKGFSIYPGLSIVCISPKAEKVMEKCNTPRYYFDYRKYLKYYRESKQTPFTPAINLIVSMSESIDVMNNTSLQVINQKKWEVFNYLNEELEKLNFVNKVPKDLRTCSMLCMEAPKGIDCEKMRNFVSANSNNYFELGRNEKRHSVIRVGISRLITIDDAKIVVKNIKKFIESEKNEK